MFHDLRVKRTFQETPQSVSALVAAFLEPLIVLVAYVAAAQWFGSPLGTADLALCLVALALAFPGANRFWQEPAAIVRGVAAGWAVLAGALAAGLWATQSLEKFDLRVLAAWTLCTPALQCAAVIAGRHLLLAHRRLAAQRRPTVIIGAGALAAEVAGALQQQHAPELLPIGVFDDRSAERVDARVGVHVKGGLADVASFVRRHAVREVYITVPLGARPRATALLHQLQGTTASLYFVPDLIGTPVIQGRLRELGGIPVVGLCETPFTGINALLKRVCDVLLASVILVLAAPLLAGIAAGVKLSSPGPVIFRQRRNGLDGHEIVVYKFRSMRVQEDGAQVRQATRSDARVTPFGAFLRRTSLDEMPQFINVLQGRMSIVGPRPHAVAHNEKFAELLRSYNVRHKVKPGITGLAQVSGCRGETDTLEKMQSRLHYDLEYLREWSLALDLRIIARTVKLVFADPNAY
jgi:putative colanic acid biosynthesis UDP-glucose lipid carrier transferase